MVMRGDEEVTFRSAARSVSPAQWDELMQRISQSMGYAGTVTNAEFSRPDDTTDPLPHHLRLRAREVRRLGQSPHHPSDCSHRSRRVDEKDPPVTPIEIGEPHVDTPTPS